MNQPKEDSLAIIIASSKQALVYIAIFSFFINLLMLTLPLYMLQIYGRVLTSSSIDTLLFLTTIAIMAILVYALLEAVRNRVALQIGNWLEKRLGSAALTRVPDAILQGSHYAGQSLRDISTMRTFLTSAGMFAIFDTLWSPIFFLIIGLMQPILGAIAVSCGVLLFILAIGNEILTRKPYERANKQKIVTQNYIDSALRNAEVIQAMGMMSHVIHNWEEKNNHDLSIQTIANKRSSYFISASRFLRLLAQILILGVGAYFVVENISTPGIMIAASILMSRALAPVEQAISVWRQLILCHQAYKRLKEHFAHGASREAKIKLPSPKGQIDLQEVIYIPLNAKKPIINGINLHIPAGALVAIIGPSGAGKSTLARLLVGALMPTRGKVRLDQADVFSWNRDDFGRYVGYLPQDVELFSGTIKDNIARLGAINEEAVIEAAKMTGVHSLILHLPDSYNTVIDPDHLTLSGGQRQRIALARALYQKPRLIVLDEPNASLDTEGEDALIKALLAMKAVNATQLIITHKVNLLKLVDYIIVLQAGQIITAGPREEVLNKISHSEKSM